MQHVLAMFAVCLLYAGSTAAAKASCDNNWTPETKRLSRTGIVLETGIEDLKVDRRAPPDLLKKIGPLLCAAGSEELRVIDVADRSYFGDPARHAERGIRLVEFIRGHEVRQSFVNISLNVETNEVMMLIANFLPDRGLDHEPRLTAAQAKAKVEARMGKDSSVERTSGERVKSLSMTHPPNLRIPSRTPSGSAPSAGCSSGSSAPGASTTLSSIKSALAQPRAR